MYDFITEQETATASKNGKKMPITDVETGKVLMVQLKGDEAPREAYLVLLGPESHKMRRALFMAANRDKSETASQEITEAEADAEVASDAKMLASLVAGGELPIKGKWVNVTPEIAEEAFAKVMNLRRQATAFSLKLGNFKKG